MNFQFDKNTIIVIAIIVTILFIYFGYYRVKDMVGEEIRDFYIKTEKIKRGKEREIIRGNRIQKRQKSIERDTGIMNDDFDFGQIELNDFVQEPFIKHDNMARAHEPELDIESFVDPLKGKEIERGPRNNMMEKIGREREIGMDRDNGEDQNRILSDRIFNP